MGASSGRRKQRQSHGHRTGLVWSLVRGRDGCHTPPGGLRLTRLDRARPPPRGVVARPAWEQTTGVTGVVGQEEGLSLPPTTSYLQGWVRTTPGEEAPGGEPCHSSCASEAVMTTSSTELARVDEAPLSPAGLYLRDIAAVTLLTAEQEIELAQLIEAGKKARRRLRHGVNLPEADRASLDEAVARGGQAP